MEEIKFKVTCKNIDGSIETAETTVDEDNAVTFVTGSTPGPQGEIADIVLGKTLDDNDLTEFDYAYICNVELDSDRTFTFKDGPDGDSPSYKGNITNTGANSIDLTFTGITVIATNDPAITINNNVLTLPAGAEIEINVQDGHMVVYNWSI